MKNNKRFGMLFIPVYTIYAIGDFDNELNIQETYPLDNTVLDSIHNKCIDNILRMVYLRHNIKELEHEGTIA